MSALAEIASALGEHDNVVDADTIRVDGRPARVTGHDAPELEHPGQSYEPGAVTAMQYLRGALAGTAFEDTGSKDRYGRELVTGRHNGEDLGTEMIRSGVSMPMFKGGTAEANQAYVQAHVRQANPQARTEWDNRMDAERAATPYQVNFDSYESRFQTPESATSRAWDRGVAGIKASLGGAGVYLGEKFSSDWLKHSGEEAMANGMLTAALNPTDVNGWEDADTLAKQGKYIYERAVENVPNMATMVAGGVGGVTTRALLAGVGKAAIKRAATDAGAKALMGSMAAWRVAGASAAVYPMHLGESAMELMDSDVQLKDANSPFLTAAVNTLLDVGPFEAMLHYSFKGLDAAMARDLVNQAAQTVEKKGLWRATLQAAKETSKGAALSAPLEGVTEWTQELVNQTARAYYDPTYNIHSAEAQAARTESFIAGAAVGGAFGGAGRGAAHVVGRMLPRPAGSDGDQPEQPGPTPTETPAHAPEQPADLQGQVDAVVAGNKPGVLVSADQPAEQAAAVAESAAASGLHKVDVPGKGTLYTKGAPHPGVASADPAKVEEAVAQSTLGISATKPTPDQVVVQTKDAQGRTVAEARAKPEDVPDVAAATAGQGASQTVKTPQQVLAGRSRAFVDPGVATVPTPMQRLAEALDSDQRTRLRDFLQGQQEVDEDPTASVVDSVPQAPEGTTAGAPAEPSRFEFRAVSGTQDDIDRLKAQAAVFTALLKHSNERIQAIADQFSVDTKDGTTAVTATMPPSVARAPDSDIGFLKAIASALSDGVNDPRNQIAFRTTLVERKGGGARQVRVNGPALARAGAQLMGINLDKASRADQRGALVAGVAWLMERGVIPEARAIKDSLVVVPRREGSGEAPVLWKDVERAIRDTASGKAHKFNIENAAPSGASPSFWVHPEQRAGEDLNRRYYEDTRPDTNFETPAFDNSNTSRPLFESEGLEDPEAPPSEVDARRFQPETGQNEASTRATTGGTRDPLKVSGVGVKSLGDSPWLAGLARAATVALDAAGLKGVDVTLVDESALRDLMAEYRQRSDVSRERNADMAHNAAIIESALVEEPDGRVMFLRDPDNAGRVRPVVFVSHNASPAKRPLVLLHEIGHIVLAHQLTQADDATKAALRTEFGEDRITFQENFANLFASWVIADTGVRDKVLDAVADRKKNGSILKTVFKKIEAALRSAWRAMQKHYEKEIPKFSDFMRAWLGVVETKPTYPTTELGKAFQKTLKEKYGMNSPVIQPMLPRDAVPAEYLDFTPFDKIKQSADNLAARNAKAKRVMEFGAKTGRSFGDTMGYIYNSYLQPLDSVLRAMNVPEVTKLADQFFRRPRGESTVHGATVHHEIEMQSRPFHDRIAAIAEKHVPKWQVWHMIPFVKKPEPSAELKQAVKENIDGNPQSPLAKEISAFFADMYGWLRANNMHVGHQSNYFPRAWDTTKLLENREGFTKSVKDWAMSDVGKAWFKEQGEEVTAGRAASFAESLYTIFTSGDGSLALTEFSDPNKQEFEFLSPGFGQGKQRVLPHSLVESLRNYREEDAIQLMTSYTRAAIKRGVWQKRFGLNDVLEDIRRLFEDAKMGGGAKAWAEAIAYRDRKVAEYAKMGINIYDPAAGLKEGLRKAYDRGDLSEANYRRIVDQVIPAYQGMLGADKTSPKWRRFQAVMMVYQNLRVLSLSALSQFVDPALIASRLPPGYRTGLFAAAVKMMTDKPTREMIMNDARLLGLVRDDITAHILNDDAGVMLATRNIQRTNEAFFRYNGMHFLTNVWRAAALHMGKRLVEDWARNGDAKQLAELGITLADANDWVSQGMPLEWSERHGAVLGGLNQFVDEGVMRPTPMSRPAIGSDHRYQIFWHLKSFTWTYATTVLQRVWTESVRKWGQEEGARKALAMIPALTLMAFTLPAAALGMELRWLIAPPKQEYDRGGWDYFWQMVQRSGLLGVAQMMADMNDAEQHHQLPLLAPLGPTVSQVVEFSQKDFGTAAMHAVPAYPIAQFIGRAM